MFCLIIIYIFARLLLNVFLKKTEVGADAKIYRKKDGNNIVIFINYIFSSAI